MDVLAAKSGVSQSAISYIEKGERKPTAETIEALADALAVDPCWLAYGTGVAPEGLDGISKG